MKITERQLRRIIKEEKAKLLKEAAYGDTYAFKVRQTLLDAHSEIAQELESQGIRYHEANEAAADRVMELVDNYLDGVGMRGKLGR